ncbi:MAG: methylenetetrahydrofolate reductase [Steroidobacteraceae bacterium]
MSAIVAPDLSGDDIKRSVVEFARAASTEISTLDEGNLPALFQELAPGTSVYIAHTPKATLDDVVRIAIRVQAVGLHASPHIVARRIDSREALRSALAALRAGGVEQVLLVAGDLSAPAGSFASTLDVLATGYLEEAGIARAGVAGHPEGNTAIEPAALWSALAQKQAYSERTGVKLHIVSQFSFDPDAICAWDQSLASHGIRLPVHVGIAGPTPLPKLIKFAVQCGVGASLRSVMKNMSAMSKMARLATSPDEMLVGLIRGSSGNSATLLRQPHFFAFGGAVATAQWLRRVREGRFELPPDGGKFLMNA